jgi:hypothetical protein
MNFRKQLKKEGIDVKFLEDFLEKQLNENDAYFKVTFKEAFEYYKSNRSLKNSIRKKSKEFSKVVSIANEAVKESHKIIDNINTGNNKNRQRLYELTEILKNFKLDIWNQDDKALFYHLVDKYIYLNAKNKAGLAISKLLLRNEWLKIAIQTLIFFISFLGSYLISPTLEKLYSPLGTFLSKLIPAIFLFITLEKLLNLLEDRLLYKRVEVLFKKHVKISSMIDSCKEIVTRYKDEK